MASAAADAATKARSKATVPAASVCVTDTKPVLQRLKPYRSGKIHVVAKATTYKDSRIPSAAGKGAGVHSVITDFTRFLGRSTSQPLRTA